MSRTDGSGSVEPYTVSTGKTLWSIRYRVPDPGGGTVQKRERGFDSQKQAASVLRQRLAAIDTGGYVAPTSQTFAEYANEWLTRQAVRVRPGTDRTYRAVLDHYLLPSLGAVPIQRLDSARIDSLYARLLIDGGSDGGPLSASSVRLAHAVVSGVLSDANRRKVTVVNEADKATAPSRTRQQRDLLDGWNRQTLRTLLTGSASDPHGIPWRLAAMTGARRGELLALTWDRTDLDAGRISIDRTLLDALGGRPSYGPTKSGHGTRVLDLDEATVEALRRHRAAQAQTRLLLGPAWAAHGLVFTHPDGGALQGEAVSKAWRGTTARLGLARVKFHGLRHLHATLLLESGAPIHVVSRRLGHASAAFTLSVYSHSLPHQDRAAIDTLAVLL